MDRRALFPSLFFSIAAACLLIRFSRAADPLDVKTAPENTTASSGSASSGVSTTQQDAKTVETAKDAAGLKLFDDVHPVLIAKCLKCHGGQKTESGFNLANREGLLKGGDGGLDVIAGKASESLLVKLLTHEEDPHMPKDGEKLSDDEIKKIAAWIDAGATYSKPLVTAGAPQGHPNVTDADRNFWSFLPLAKVQPPEVNAAQWCRTPIDRFIFAKLDEKGIVPNRVADRRTLIRRAYFDLIGLPPTYDEVEAFVHDPAPDAYDRWIDRLLENSHYGERWARHWLDVARFAESHGYEQDYDRPYAYHYRDFVIRAFNEDLPFDQFVRWQIAGDEFEPDNPDAWMATGFLAAGTHATQITANQAEKERYDELDDQAATVGTAFLGLTIGCARCHDHKYDPIPTSDYYRLIATFTTTVRSDYPVITNAADYNLQKQDFDREHAPLVAAVNEYTQQVVNQRLFKWDASPSVATAICFATVEPSILQKTIAFAPAICFRASDAQYRELVFTFAKHAVRTPWPKTTRALVCSEGVPAIRLHTQGPDYYEATYQLKRGDLNQKLEAAKPGFLQVLERGSSGEAKWREAPPADSRTLYNRRALASWITDADDGAGHLLARVIVNRLWQHHFGRGIVATPSDFGGQGARPTHPELLDWLASQLVQNGWRLKPLQKMMMTSAVYMESDDYDSNRAAIDPDNLLLWRHSRRRLEAEIVRDSLLAASGTLDATMFGPGSLSESQRRRSIYFTIKRSKMIPVLTLFDAPDSLQSAGDRPSTTVAPQALWMMNNSEVHSYAQALAEKLQPEVEKSTEAGVTAAYHAVLNRSPNDSETTDAAAFFAKQIESYRSDGKSEAAAQTAALANFCQALFATNEFIFVE